MKETEKKDRDPLLFSAPFTSQEKESKERERDDIDDDDLHDTRTHESASQRPESTSQRPESASQRPESASQRPESASQRPESASQRPESASQCASRFCREVSLLPLPEFPHTATASGQAAGDDDTIDIKAFIDYFNRTMPPGGIPKIMCVQGTRKAALTARCRQYGKRAVLEMVNRAARSRFLNGGGPRGWCAGIDWLLRPNIFPRVVEGQYDDHDYLSQKRSYTPDEARRAAARIIEQERHDELQASIQRRQQRAVSYEEYQQMLRDGRVKPPTE